MEEIWQAAARDVARRRRRLAQSLGTGYAEWSQDRYLLRRDNEYRQRRDNMLLARKKPPAEAGGERMEEVQL